MEFGRDLRFAIRDLKRAPGSTLVSVCTLAVAIGASTAVFSVIDKVLLRPLPIEEPDRVTVVWPRDRANPTSICEVSTRSVH
jgi:putative ABC transport system permease protein